MSMCLGVKCQSMRVEVSGQSQVTTFVFHLEMGVSCGLQQGLLVVWSRLAGLGVTASILSLPPVLL